MDLLSAPMLGDPRSAGTLLDRWGSGGRATVSVDDDFAFIDNLLDTLQAENKSEVGSERGAASLRESPRLEAYLGAADCVDRDLLGDDAPLAPSRPKTASEIEALNAQMNMLLDRLCSSREDPYSAEVDDLLDNFLLQANHAAIRSASKGASGAPAPTALPQSQPPLPPKLPLLELPKQQDYLQVPGGVGSASAWDALLTSARMLLQSARSSAPTTRDSAPPTGRRMGGGRGPPAVVQGGPSTASASTEPGPTQRSSGLAPSESDVATEQVNEVPYSADMNPEDQEDAWQSRNADAPEDPEAAAAAAAAAAAGAAAAAPGRCWATPPAGQARPSPEAGAACSVYLAVPAAPAAADAAAASSADAPGAVASGSGPPAQATADGTIPSARRELLSKLAEMDDQDEMRALMRRFILRTRERFLQACDEDARQRESREPSEVAETVDGQDSNVDDGEASVWSCESCSDTSSAMPPY
eukprot:TRINITY_DN23251_c0_g2_i1.p1 TRINITY_DN23251_c0_g2~~TRINITY_DN23251_c0_g2_i1.p1  ORF type:complete len:472 (-),score=120.05 TRINITY_DN23251_c0_g2_i1:247-1662(-)